MDTILETMRSNAASLAIAAGDVTTSYADLSSQVRQWKDRLCEKGVRQGEVVGIEGDYAAQTIAALLAAAALRTIIVPLSSDSQTQHDEFRRMAAIQWRLHCEGETGVVDRLDVTADLPLYERLRTVGHAGLVLFTSGSTGNSKAAVHDFHLLLEKFRQPRQTLRTLVFLQLDHIGGINTLLYTISNGGAVIVPQDRSPAAVCRAIDLHRAELLPTSPTFLNLLLLSREYEHHDLSSLRLITYGTEPMPPSTLERLNAEFPNVKLQQTYGLTELGILRSKSRDSRSLWVRVGGEGFETKVVDGRLWIRARSAMLGYLNAPSPFDEEGFFDTGDRVEVEGDWLRILGRESEVVNVGGNKVSPTEVESVLLDMEGVVDAAVCGERHPLVGQVVTATVRLAKQESPAGFRTRMRQFCGQRLPSYAIPAKVRFTEAPLHNSRFKRMRKSINN